MLPAGELDLSTAVVLDAQLEELFAIGWTEVTVDLREIEFMDRSGVHVLLRGRRAANGGAGRLRIVVEPGPVETLLTVTGAAAVLHLHGTAGAL